MRKVNAHKTEYQFTDTPEKAEKYRIFMKEHILELSPSYYGVTNIQKVLTPDGMMYAAKLVSEVDNPEYEIIAECWINNTFIYLWRDKCWMIAEDKEKRSVFNVEWESPFDFISNKKPLSKIVLLFQIGEECTTQP